MILICRFNDGKDTCECYDKGFAEGKKIKTIVMGDQEKIDDGYDIGYQKGFEAGKKERIEHCDIKECPECNLKAYNKGLKDGMKAKAEGISKSVIGLERDKAYEKGKKEVIDLLKKVEKEKWNDAEHCTCLGYVISKLEEMK